MQGSRFLTGAVCSILGLSGQAISETATVGVAANFADAAEALAVAFQEKTGHVIMFTVGSTGNLFSQIAMGAPLDVFMAADQARPESIERFDLGVAGSRMTYAVGHIALWSSDPGYFTDGLQALQDGGFQHLAMANPNIAPYGVAAQQALEYYGLWDAVEGNVVYGENIAQTFVLVQTANAELGLVAASSVAAAGEDGAYWPVPIEAYDPIRQDAILLKTGEGNDAAVAFMSFLASDAAEPILNDYGYGVAE